MQQHKINVVNREKSGRSISRRLRSEGKIPACVYSKGESRSISVSAIEFRELRRSLSGAALIELVDEKGESALTHIQEIQRDIISNNVNHIDFHEVERGKLFVAQVPVHLVGESDCIGVRNEGGILDHKRHSMEVRCIPSNLPDQINVDVSALQVGEAIHIRDLETQEGIEYTDAPELVIASCQPPTVVTQEPTGTAEEESIDASEVPASKVKSDSDQAE